LFVCSLVEASLVPSKEAGQEDSAVHVKYVPMCREQNSGQNHKIKIGNKPFENLAKFKYVGTTITNRNCKHEEIKGTLNSGHVCCHSVQNLLSSSLLSKV
jgi:tetrahydromethanopterin S-methyltransferase subunit A